MYSIKSYGKTLENRRTTTEGWTLLDDKAVKLTKDQCDVKLNEFMASGVNASRMRAVPDVGQAYTTPDV